jgi:uncharacterized protein YfaP (DUF2135 family)
MKLLVILVLKISGDTAHKKNTIINNSPNSTVNLYVNLYGVKKEQVYIGNLEQKQKIITVDVVADEVNDDLLSEITSPVIA